jgi:hypothetical protein
VASPISISAPSPNTPTGTLTPLLAVAGLLTLLGLGLAMIRHRPTAPPAAGPPAPARGPAPTGAAVEAELQELLAEEHARRALERRRELEERELELV